MTNIGMRRNIDRIGRIVIPKELRDFFKIDEGTSMEVIGTNEGILIRFPEYEIIKIAEKNTNESGDRI